MLSSAATFRAARLCLPPRTPRAVQHLVVRASSSGPAESSPGPEEEAQSSDAVFQGFGRRQQQGQQQQGQQQKTTAADALQNTLAGLSASVGRVPQGNNVILDTTNDEGKWRELDMQVNEYPGQRTFKAIGRGGQDFVVAMTDCVESVVGTVHQECINQRASANQNYVSVTIGPVWVENPDQMLQIYEKMKQDGRLRFFF